MPFRSQRQQRKVMSMLRKETPQERRVRCDICKRLVEESQAHGMRGTMGGIVCSFCTAKRYGMQPGGAYTTHKLPPGWEQTAVDEWVHQTGLRVQVRRSDFGGFEVYTEMPGFPGTAAEFDGDSQFATTSDATDMALRFLKEYKPMPQEEMEHMLATSIGADLARRKASSDAARRVISSKLKNPDARERAFESYLEYEGPEAG